MRVKIERLDSQLRQSLAPVYLLCGDEPLQLTEAADSIRRECRRQGIEERQVYSVLPGFDWHVLAAEADTLSLFASRRLLDIRVPEGKVGAEGGRALSRYCERPPNDTVLLLILENLPPAAQKSRWFKQLEQTGVVVQVHPLHGREFIAWLQRRADSKGVRLTRDALQLLAFRTEGNLLAAAQEIDKLVVLYGNNVTDADRLVEAVANSSRFGVFDLAEAVLVGQIRRTDRIVAGLAAEGVALPVILWAITREVRLLLTLLDERSRGVSLAESSRRHHLWERRRLQLDQALGRLGKGNLYLALEVAARIDAMIKGQAEGDPWELLRSLCLALAAADTRLLTMATH